MIKPNITKVGTILFILDFIKANGVFPSEDNDITKPLIKKTNLHQNLQNKKHIPCILLEENQMKD